MDEKEVRTLIGKHIMLYNTEDSDRYPGVINQFNLVDAGGEKPFRMMAAVSEIEASKGRVVNDWTFAVSADDINKLLKRQLVVLSRPVNIDGYDLVLYYSAVLVN